MPEVSEIIEDIYPVALYLSTTQAAKNGLFNDGVDIELPLKIHNLGRSIKRMYDADPTDSTLFKTANCLYGIMGLFGAEAQAINGTAGSISGITPASGAASAIDWIVSGTSSGSAPLANSESSVLLNGSSGMPDLRGYNVEFVRGSLPQYTTDPGDGTTYFGWNKTTGLFTLYNGAAVTGERMRITPTI